MARVLAVVFLAVGAVYFFEIFSGRSFGVGDQIHNLGQTVADFTGFQVFGKL